MDEIIAISDTAAIRQAFCGIEERSRSTKNQSRRALRRFAESLVLILRRLLNEIQEHTAIIIADDSADDAENARLYKIMATVERGQKLLRDLRQYAGIAVPFVKRIRSETLAEIVRVTCFGRREDIRCHLNLDPGLADVEMDGGWMYTILRKLYDNAAEAMPKGGDLFIKVKNHPGSRCRQPGKGKSGMPCVRIKFRDTGQGMAPEILRRVFDPFYTTKLSKSHSGLGLAVVEGLLQTTGGRIRVDSTPDQGTTFTIDLPAAEMSSGLLNAPAVAAHAAIENIGKG